MRVGGRMILTYALFALFRWAVLDHSAQEALLSQASLTFLITGVIMGPSAYWAFNGPRKD